MTKKDLDYSFVNYGIHNEDFAVIEKLCAEYGVEFDWLKEDVWYFDKFCGGNLI